MPNDSVDSTTVSTAHHPLTAESLQVSLTVADARLSAAWYHDALGFTIDREIARDERLIAVGISASAMKMLLVQDNGAKGAERVKGEGFSIQITTRDNIDALAMRAKGAGAVLDTEPSDAWGKRVFRLRDPDGFRLVISSPGTP
jgi:uncharacterized glyoxalase superfamily protein PhnB